MDLAGYGFVMAGLAIELAVLALELVVGLGVMIEFPYTPAIGVMAGGTTLAERVLVNVVLLVAGVTVEGIHLVAGVQVAFLARHRCVQADERKASHVMIEDHPLIPSLFIVAAVA